METKDNIPSIIPEPEQIDFFTDIAMTAHCMKGKEASDLVGCAPTSNNLRDWWRMGYEHRMTMRGILDGTHEWDALDDKPPSVRFAALCQMTGHDLPENVSVGWIAQAVLRLLRESVDQANARTRSLAYEAAVQHVFARLGVEYDENYGRYLDEHPEAMAEVIELFTAILAESAN